MSNVVYDTGIVTKLDLPPERILQSALKADLADVVVIAYTKDGDEYFASSAADGGYVLWMIERAKLKLIQEPDRE